MNILILASKISDVTTVDWYEQILRFFTFSDSSVQFAILGTMILGFSCGLIGTFLVTRQQALYGDTLSHAVLPGIVIAFLFTLTKDSLSLMLGALTTAILAAIFFEKLKKSRVIKIDCAMGLSLTGFYAIGIALLTMTQNIPSAQQAGLDKFLFGQASALSAQDLCIMGIALFFNGIIIFLFYKQLITISFDPLFAQILGIKHNIFNGLLTLLTAITIVTSIKAVGVVLVSALLIIPAATAILLTQRFHWVLLISAGLGVLSSALGTLISFVQHNLPTGPFIVIVASFFFTMVFMFHPQEGFLANRKKNKEHAIH